MDELTMIDLGKQTLLLALMIVTPALLVGMFVGLAVSLFQTITALQEQTLSIVPQDDRGGHDPARADALDPAAASPSSRADCSATSRTSDRSEPEERRGPVDQAAAQAIFEQLPGIVLHLLRAGAFLTVVPMFGSQSSSRMLRIILALSIGSILWWTTPATLVSADSFVELGFLSIREVGIGVLAGFAIRTLVVVLAVAGEIISHEMGFTMARQLNPDTGEQVTPMSQLFELMGYLVMFQLDLHHDILRVLQRAYQVVPVGRGFDFTLVYERLSAMVSQSLDFGLQYAIPIFGVLILLTVTLVILSRAVQNINLLEFSFGLRILLAFISSIFFLFEGAPFLIGVFETILEQAGGLFAPL